MRLQTLVATVLLAIAPSAFAQSGQSTTDLNTTKEINNPWTARVNGTSILLKGFGVNVGRAITKNLSAEALYSQIKMVDEDDEIDDFEAIHKARTYGVRADFFPFSTVESTGLYLSGSAVHIDLKSEVNPIFSDEVKTLNKDKWGFQGFGGYQIISKEKSFNLAARLGLGYGTGGAFSSTLGATRNEIEDGLLLDISVGVMF